MVRGRVDQSLGAEGGRSHQGVMGLAMIFGCRGQILKELGILGVGKPEKEWIAAAFLENLYIFLEKTESICLQHF